MYILPLFFMQYIQHTFINIPAILYICLHMFLSGIHVGFTLLRADNPSKGRVGNLY